MSAKASICNILAEAICSIDEDNKHTDAIQALLTQARESKRATEMSDEDGDDDDDDAVGLSFVSTVKVIWENKNIIMNIGYIFCVCVVQLDDVEAGNVAGNPSPSTRTAEEYDVENAEYIAELLVSDVLTNSVGKQCMKVGKTL